MRQGIIIGEERGVVVKTKKIWIRKWFGEANEVRLSWLHVLIGQNLQPSPDCTIDNDSLAPTSCV
jgi:hypothetical protein